MTTDLATASPDMQQTWALVTAAQTGDQSAFAALYRQYHPLVYKYALCRVASVPVAEDITSETFLRALRRLRSLNYQGRDFGAWLTVIARNLILDRAKSNYFNREISTADIRDASSGILDPARDPARDDDRGPEQQAIDADLADRLNRHLAQLTSGQRRCVELRFLHELSTEETAQAMGSTYSAIKTLQWRALRKLAQLMPPEAA